MKKVLLLTALVLCSTQAQAVSPQAQAACPGIDLEKLSQKMRDVLAKEKPGSPKGITAYEKVVTPQEGVCIRELRTQKKPAKGTQREVILLEDLILKPF